VEIHVKIIGALLIFLSMIHVIFPKYFNWKEELARLSLVNKEMMIIHTFFISFMVLLMGILCITSSSELVNTPFGKKIAFGFAIFWFVRLLVQFFGYSSNLWKGKKMETTVHIIFSLFWLYCSLTFLLVSL